MNLSPQESNEPSIDMTAMIDVVFLLLLFFMVSTSFVRESSLKVDLPEATGQAMTEQDNPVDIVIQTDGTFLIDKVSLGKVSKTAFISALKKAVGEQQDPHIIISADTNTAYQNIVTAMDAAQQLGYSRLTLATRQKEQSKK